MGPVRVGIAAISLGAALVGHANTSEVPAAMIRVLREIHKSDASTEPTTTPRRRTLRSTADHQHDGGLKTPCLAGSGLTVTSTQFPLMQGCLAEMDVFTGGKTEYAGPAAKITSLPDGGGEDAPRNWFAALYDEEKMLEIQCCSEELVSLVHPSEATWLCVNDDGFIGPVEGLEFSIACGCKDGPDHQVTVARSHPRGDYTPPLGKDTERKAAVGMSSHAPERASVCKNNGIPGVESSGGMVCCAAGCKTCGGAGCSAAGADAGLTADDCCATEILAFGDACSKTLTAPCYVDDGSQADGEVDERCRVSGLSTSAMEQLNTYERGLYLDPDCDNGGAVLPAHCNYSGLGQRCRGCFMSLAGARNYMADFFADERGQDPVINFCPGTDLHGLKEA